LRITRNLNWGLNLERQLVSIQEIKEVCAIEGADLIELVKVLGWHCVAKKGQFKVGDRCVYHEIDSYLPIKPVYEFLRKGCYKKIPERNEEGFRIRTIKLRGQISQGLVMPISDFPEIPANINIGDEVTKLLGVWKYEPYIPPSMSGEIRGNWPCYIPKTDEMRIQAIPDIIAEIRGREVYTSVKYDGTSCTIYNNQDEFGVCSRDVNLVENEKNLYWKVANKYNLKERMKEIGTNLSIQGEICGPGIQSNKMHLTDIELFVFNVFHIDTGKYVDFKDFIQWCELLKVKTVPIIETRIFDWQSVDELLKYAKGKYDWAKYNSDCKGNREGVVIRTTKEMHSKVLRGRMSFKIINNDFLIEWGE
jgi:RNA ligase (TIGR02306 family)